jgi:hypothetical protein
MRLAGPIRSKLSLPIRNAPMCSNRPMAGLHRTQRGGYTLALALLVIAGTARAITPNEWQFKQTVDVPAGGLIRVNLPPETLNAARSNLEDLRVVDTAGHEVPYLIDRAAPRMESKLRPKEFHAEIGGATTRLIIATGAEMPLHSVAVESAGTAQFIKSVRVEGSHNGAKWQPLAEHEPIFRMAGGATKLTIPFLPGVWEYVRLTIDDSKTAPVPFTGALLEGSGFETALEPLPVTIKSRDESPGLTRLVVNLGATNLTPAALEIETPERLFTRAITVAVPAVAGDDIAEQPVAAGVVYRVDLNGGNEARLDIPIDTQIQSSELLLLVSNGDSPPLVIREIRGQRRAVHLVFMAPNAGRYQLLSGNKHCAAPNYDLSPLAADLKRANATELKPSALTTTPDYKPANNLAAISLQGAVIDVAPWKFRKKVELSTAGVQQLELDPEVLARAARELRDVRLVRDGRQVPFLLERTSISRALNLAYMSEKDAKKASLSKWSLKLQRSGLPITRVVGTAQASSGVFQREARLLENIADERGDNYIRQLAQATWRRLPDQETSDFTLTLNTPPETDTLILEMDNGDNPALELTNFRAYYPVTRVIFEATPNPGQSIWLYYGNPNAPAPRYDVNLVASQLLRSERIPAGAGEEENLKGTSSLVSDTLTGSARYIFWSVLAVVVVTLLFFIARLLPKTP